MFRWLRWHYRARDRPPRHRYLLICLYHRLVRRGGVVGGVHDHNTRPMSTTSVASEYFRYFTGIASISFNMPFHSEPAPKSWRKCNSPGERCSRWRMVKIICSAATQSTVVWWWVLLVCFMAAEPLARGPLEGGAWFEKCRMAFEKACTNSYRRAYEALLLDKRPYLARDFLVLFQSLLFSPPPGPCRHIQTASASHSYLHRLHRANPKPNPPFNEPLPLILFMNTKRAASASSLQTHYYNITKPNTTIPSPNRR